MLDTITWKENFLLRKQNSINNAYATLVGNKRWIEYNNNFLENMDSYTASKWASYSAVAHEMGYHYYNHVLNAANLQPRLQ